MIMNNYTLNKRTFATSSIESDNIINDNLNSTYTSSNSYFDNDLELQVHKNQINEDSNRRIELFQRAKQIILKEINEDNNYKNELMKITESFLASLELCYISECELYSLDDDSIVFNFLSNGISCYVQLFYSPDELSEYLALVRDHENVLLHQISDRTDFKDISKVLPKCIETVPNNERQYQLNTTY